MLFSKFCSLTRTEGSYPKHTVRRTLSGRLGRILSLAAVGLLSLADQAAAANVSVHWNENPETDVAGYTVYYGNSASSLTSTTNAGASLNAVLSGLTAGQTYYFSVSAYSSAGMESDPSPAEAVIIPVERTGLDTDGDGTPDLLDDDDDNDGLSDVFETSIGTNPLDVDSDHDGYFDAREVQDGSNPLDAASFGTQYAHTICSDWNGFLGGMWNILELLNMSSQALPVRVILYTQAGQIGSQQLYTIAPGQKQDSLVHEMAGWQLNSYGSVCASYNGNTSDLSGQMVYYKTATGKSALLGEAFDFAISLPLSAGAAGRQYVPFDTVQRSLVTTDRANLVTNWIQISNRSSQTGTGKLRFYRLSGVLLGELSVAVAAGGRADYAAHQFGAGQDGYVEWIPDSATIPFQVRNVRYYYDNSGATDTFATAAEQDGVLAGADMLSIPVATDNTQSSLVGVTNIGNVGTNVTVNAYDVNGKSLFATLKFALPAKATWRYSLNGVIKAKKALLIVKSSVPGSLISSAVQFTLRNKSLGMLHVVPAVKPAGTVLRGSYNNFLGQQSLVVVTNPGTTTLNVQVSAANSAGVSTLVPTAMAIPPKGFKVLSVTGADQYGVVTAQADQPNTLVSWVMRTRPDFIIPTRMGE
ncbi:MAG: fibronectin type III domain-containing protein [Bdellovibrionota bacterium]